MVGHLGRAAALASYRAEIAIMSESGQTVWFALRASDAILDRVSERAEAAA